MSMSYINGGRTSTKQVTRIGKHSELIVGGKSNTLEYAKHMCYRPTRNRKKKNPTTPTAMK